MRSPHIPKGEAGWLSACCSERLGWYEKGTKRGQQAEGVFVDSSMCYYNRMQARPMTTLPLSL